MVITILLFHHGNNHVSPFSLKWMHDMAPFPVKYFEGGSVDTTQTFMYLRIALQSGLKCRVEPKKPQDAEQENNKILHYLLYRMQRMPPQAQFHGCTLLWTGAQNVSRRTLQIQRDHRNRDSAPCGLTWCKMATPIFHARVWRVQTRHHSVHLNGGNGHFHLANMGFWRTNFVGQQSAFLNNICFGDPVEVLKRVCHGLLAG